MQKKREKWNTRISSEKLEENILTKVVIDSNF